VQDRHGPDKHTSDIPAWVPCYHAGSIGNLHARATLQTRPDGSTRPVAVQRVA